MLVVGGYPVPAIREVAASMPVRLVPIEGELLETLRKEFSFYYPTEIPAGSYPGIDTPTTSLGSSALWAVNAEVPPDLVFAITDSLWNPATGKILSTLDPIGTRIRLPRALDGLSVPLHPGAERFYREKGMPVDATPKVAGEPAEKKEP
jgi:TRAP transporter TAXI family solute receptor